MMQRAELALIPALGAGHLGPMVELGKAITSRDHRISVTIFIMELSFHSKLDSYTQALLSNQPPPCVRFVRLSLDETTSDRIPSMSQADQMNELLEINKPHVQDFYDSAQEKPAAFMVDMFCTAFADVAKVFGVHTYVFATSNAHFLSLLFYVQSVYDDENRDFTEFRGSDTEFSVLGFMHPVPCKVVPFIFFEKEHGSAAFFLNVSRGLRKAKGILINTFTEFEPYTIECLSKDSRVPPIHAVGPVLNASNNQNDLGRYEEIMTWLDSQPPASVVFLCFGSTKAFEVAQVVEIACALEHSGHRFLWALRKPPPKGKTEPPSEYMNFNDVLPEGFLERTRETGKVVGWAPQVAVLSHPAVGGFISHCGWNSTLESLFSGVPMATWPLTAEQQLNAFELVKELGFAVEIKLDYQIENQIVLAADEIVRGIKQLMEGSASVEFKKKVKTMREECMRAVVDGGSSYAALGHVIEEILNGSS